MKTLVRLAAASAWSRRSALMLVACSVAVSAALLSAVVQLRADARTSFSQAVSGVDLIVAARSGASEILLYNAFQIGRPTANIDAAVLDRVRGLSGVAWAFPIQLGDSHRGHPVWGTEQIFFKHYKASGRELSFAQGRPWGNPRDPDSSQAMASTFELVAGAAFAAKFNLKLGDRLVLTHGIAEGPLAQTHDAHPFTVVGILAPTGAPIDRAGLVPVQGFEAIHLGWDIPGLGSLRRGAMAPQAIDPAMLAPKSFTSIWLGLESRGQVFSVRRNIESMDGGGVAAVMPGVALDELWRVVSVVENALALVGSLASLAALLSVAAVLLVSLQGRRREFAVLRSVGLSPAGLLKLIVVETTLVVIAGLVLGGLAQQSLVFLSADWLRTEWGLVVSMFSWPAEAWWTLLTILVAAILIAAIPAWRAYRISLADGLSPPSIG